MEDGGGIGITFSCLFSLSLYISVFGCLLGLLKLGRVWRPWTSPARLGGSASGSPTDRDLQHASAFSPRMKINWIDHVLEVDR